MHIELLFKWTANLILTKTGISLNEKQERIFYKAFEGKAYDQIANEVKREGGKLSEENARKLGSKMWNLIAEATGVKNVDKNNFRVVIQALMPLELNYKSSHSENQSANRVLSNFVGSNDSGFNSAHLVKNQKKNTSKINLNITPPVNLRQSPLQKIPRQISLGPLEIDSQLYINRQQIEENCYQEIKKPGGLVRIKAPKEMGKTSLIERIIHHGRGQGYQIVSLSLEDTDKNLMLNLDRFLKWFCFHISRELELPNRIAEYWDEDFSGSKMNCTYYLKEYILSQLEQPLLLALDDVDRIFEQSEIADDFLGLLRSWYQNAKKGQSRGIWKKMRLIISYSTEAYLIKDINQSPFNVGLGVELPEFNYNQVLEFTTRYGLSWSDEEIEKLMGLVGGHPHLVQIALNWVANKIMTLDELIEIATSEKGPYINHLRRHLQNLEQQPDLLQVFGELLEAKAPIYLKPREKFQLYSTGLINLEKRNLAIIRCDLYRLYFQQNLI